MKTLAILGAATALFVATGAQAQSAPPQTFTITGTWGEVTFTGGLGPQGMAARAGDVTGNIEVVLDNGTKVTASAHCVGMDQHPSQIFSLVLSCDTTGDDGLVVSWLLGCNPLDADESGPNGRFACVGGIQQKTGDAKGARGGMTMLFDGKGKSNGTGQWYGAPSAN